VRRARSRDRSSRAAAQSARRADLSTVVSITHRVVEWGWTLVAGATFRPVSYTHLTLPTSDLV